MEFPLTAGATIDKATAEASANIESDIVRIKWNFPGWTSYEHWDPFQWRNEVALRQLTKIVIKIDVNSVLDGGVGYYEQGDWLLGQFPETTGVANVHRHAAQRTND